MEEDAIIHKLYQILLMRQREAREAQTERELLAVKASILSSLCDFLRWRRDTLQSSLGLQCETVQGVIAEEAESVLVQELQHAAVCSDAACTMEIDEPAVHSATSNSSVPLSEQRRTLQHVAHQPQTLATAADPLAMFKRLFQLPPAPEVESSTLKEVLIKYAQMVRELSLAVQLHELGLENQAAKMEVLLIRCLHMLTTVAKICQSNSSANIPDLLMLCLTNYETGETVAEPDKQRHAMVATLLGLTPQQQQRIAQGTAVFTQLMSPVLQELRQLQQSTGVSGSVKNSSSSMTSGSVGQVQQQSQQQIAMQQQQQQSQQQSQQQWQQKISSGCLDPDSPSLEEQQKHAARMRLLLRKSTLLRSVSASYTYGCLSYLQLAKLHVYLSPFYPHVATFQQVVVEQLQQQQEHQRQLQDQQLVQDTESMNYCCHAAFGEHACVGVHAVDNNTPHNTPDTACC